MKRATSRSKYKQQFRRYASDRQVQLVRHTSFGYLARWRMIVQQQGLCTACNRSLFVGSKKFQVHHVKFLAAGGTHDPINLRFLHAACHIDLHQHSQRPAAAAELPTG